MNENSSEETPELFQLAYETLHGMAQRFLHRERMDHTLQATALVHEAFLKLDRQQAAPVWNDKQHFQAVAARAMRQILVDYARQRAADKRGGQWQRIPFSTGILGGDDKLDMLALHEALEQLATRDARKAKVVELRFFGGMTSAEIAKQIGISRKTVDADWYFARAWLKKRLADAD